MTTGIYILKFIGTDKVYVGRSRNIEKRFLEHLSSFRRNTASGKLQEAYITYGKPILEVLLECDEVESIIAEEEAINIYNSANIGFNTMYKSGTSTTLVGEKNSSSVYSNSKIEEVFKLLLSSSMYTHKYISDTTGVSISVIAQVSSGITHKWLEIKYPPEYVRLLELVSSRRELKQAVKDIASTSSKYTVEQYLGVVTLALQKKKAKEICKLTGVNIDVIRDITSCRRHKWLEVANPTEYQQLKLMKQKG